MIQLPKILSQRDPLWARQTLGASGLTVGDWGCTFTSCVMIATAFGKHPNLVTVLNAMNSDPQGFAPNGSLNWLPIAKHLGIDFLYRWETDADPSNRFERVKEIDGLRHVERLAEWGIPTVCFVDTNHDAKPNHWVVYVGDGMVADPWDGTVKPMSVFERLYGYAIFMGQPAYAPAGKGQVASLVGKANEIVRGRNVALNISEIMDAVKRP